jgi:hypothetical protein
MDWSNESYVRVYTRDTTTWRRLGWDGQNVLMHVIRKADRSGVLDCEDIEPWEVVMLHCGAPEEAAKRGVEACLRLGVIVHTGRALVLPNFEAAQTATKSDKLRAKESRESRRQKELSASQNVTAASRDATPDSHDVTPPSPPVTSGHAESQPVTPRHSVLCCAVHGFAMPCSACCARERDSEPEHPDREPALAFDRALWAEWCDALKLIAGASPNYDAIAKCKPALPAADVAAARRMFRAAAEAYVADCDKRGAQKRFHFFAKDFTDWLAASSSKSAAPKPAAHTPYVPLSQRGAAPKTPPGGNA